MTDEARRSGPPPLSYWAKVTVVVLGVIAAALLLNQLRSVALAVFLGLFLAIASEPFIAWLERRGLRRGLAIAVLTVGALLVLGGVITLLLYPAVQQVGQLVESLPELLRRLSDQLARFGLRFDDPAIQQRLQGLAERLPGLLGTSLGALYGILGGVLSTVFTVFTVVVLALYFMFAMPHMRSFAARALREPERVEVMNQSLDRIGGYVTGQIVVSTTAGVVSGVGLGLMGVPYAAVLGVGMALFTAIPQIGAAIGSIVCTAVALTQGLDLAIYTLLFILAYQQFENYVLVPRVFSRAVDLSPVAVFIAVLVGGSVVGAVGALTALPIAAALKVVFRYLFRDQLDRIGARPEPPNDEPADQPPDRPTG
jgi:predicted PurR-regulated permease PerM